MLFKGEKNLKTSQQVYINGKFLSQRITGVQRYAYELIKYWDKSMESGEMDASRINITILTPKNARQDLSLKHIVLQQVGNFTGTLWEQIELPFYSRKGSLVNLCNAAPVVRINQLVTIHDVSVFLDTNTYSKAFKLWYTFMLSIISRRVKKVITVSEFSLSELQKYCRVSTEKCKVIYHGKEHVYECDPDLAILDKHGIRAFNYVLAVSSLNPNKNFRLIAQAIQQLDELDFDVVIAGGMQSKVFNHSDEYERHERIKYVGYVSDSELRALYEKAGCFVYPSFYEGFGFPPLEAMTLGCPVIVSGTSSLPEVCRDAAVYIDPNRPEELAEGIKLLMGNSAAREMFIQKGFENANRFSWDLCAKQTFSFLEEEVM